MKGIKKRREEKGMNRRGKRKGGGGGFKSGTTSEESHLLKDGTCSSIKVHQIFFLLLSFMLHYHGKDTGRCPYLRVGFEEVQLC